VSDEPTLRDIFERLASIESEQKNLFRFVDSFHTLFLTLDTRVRALEINGHTCQYALVMQEFRDFMKDSQGVHRAQQPFWDIIKTWIGAILVGITMMFIGFMMGKGGN